MDVGGRVVVVTGGASGIGAATVDRLRARGARPVSWDLAGSDDVGPCDVGDPDQVAAALEATMASAGPPAGLVTAAGVGTHGLLEGLDLDEWKRALEVNLTGTMLSLRAVLPHLAAAHGAVVAVSSINGSIPTPGMAAYCVSKAGVDMLVRVAAAELGPRGVRVNGVAPGITETPLFADSAGRAPGFRDQIAGRTPLDGIGDPGDVAELVVDLLRAEWVTGQVVAADGGLGLVGPYDFG